MRYLETGRAIEFRRGRHERLCFFGRNLRRDHVKGDVGVRNRLVRTDVEHSLRR